MKYLCLDFGGTGVKYAIIDENFQLYDVNKENKIFQSHDEMITWVVDLFKTIHMKLSGIAIMPEIFDIPLDWILTESGMRPAEKKTGRNTMDAARLMQH